jgi:hypothetical protein
MGRESVTVARFSFATQAEHLFGIRTVLIQANTLSAWRFALNRRSRCLRGHIERVESNPRSDRAEKRFGAFAWNWLGGRDSNRSNVIF